jgi:hypothetical protein
MTLAVAWEAQGVTEQTITVDATELVEASRQAEKLWDIEPESGCPQDHARAIRSGAELGRYGLRDQRAGVLMISDD